MKPTLEDRQFWLERFSLDEDQADGRRDVAERLTQVPSLSPIVFSACRADDREAMEYTIEFDGTPQDVTITSNGLADEQGLVGFVRDLVSDSRFRPGMLILVDHLAVDASKVTSSALRAQAEAVIKHAEEFGDSKVAIVIPTPLAFGYSRMWESYVAGRTRIESHVFYSRAEGLEWLESTRGTGTPS